MNRNPQKYIHPVKAALDSLPERPWRIEGETIRDARGATVKPGQKTRQFIVDAVNAYKFPVETPEAPAEAPKGGKK